MSIAVSSAVFHVQQWNYKVVIVKLNESSQKNIRVLSESHLQNNEEESCLGTIRCLIKPIYNTLRSRANI